ncbi:MAG: iron ABC transporter permease [Desulfomonile tiedjei]|uniref:Iron ABC transporter permease n=1 Tax=Desulfomonile tiedjei TaxID=2358 RepID=A0A9D6V6Y9_9BACT|nr:iron ABC transporter permease [Desulfomonile tiedjei]
MRLSTFARTILISISLTGVLLVVLLISLLTGTTVTEVKTLLTGSVQGIDAQKTWTIILSYRLPRTLLAAVAGAGLASAGVVFQGVLKNPLADPYLIGIAAGGSLGAVVSISLFGERWLLGTSVCAFLGSISAVGLVYGLAVARRGRGYVNTVILAGVIVGALMNAVMLLILSLSGSHEKQRILFWLMGDFSLASYQQVLLAAVAVTVGWTLIYLNANRLNLLIVGDDTASHLGLNVFRTRTLFMLVAAMLTGATVSVSGTIGFVGLVVPHAMRLLFGPDNRVLLPAALLGGAAFLAASDCVARVVAYPMELPVGVITTLSGAPFFLYLLVKK